MHAGDAMISLNLFGPLSVTVGGRRLGPRDLNGVKPRQILELLALHRRAVSKEELVDALFGRRMPVDPVATLESYVSVLRNVLQPGVHRDDSLIATVQGGYTLVRERALIDIDRFDEIVRSLPSLHDHDRRSLLLEAAEIAAGKVLENEPYAEWVQSERRHYERLRLDVFVAAAEACVEAGDGARALDVAERAVAADSTCEVAYLAGMRAAGVLGRRDMVARIYQQCERAMRSELGVAPMGVTTELRDELLQAERRLVGSGSGLGEVRDADERELGACRWPSSRFG